MNNQDLIKTSFWDFKSKKVYTNIGDKILDFLGALIIASIPINFLGSKIFSIRYEQFGAIDPYDEVFSISNILPSLIGTFVVILLFILGIFYFWKRRRYIAYGFLLQLVIAVLLIFLLFPF